MLSFLLRLNKRWGVLFAACEKTVEKTSKSLVQTGYLNTQSTFAQLEFSQTTTIARILTPALTHITQTFAQTKSMLYSLLCDSLYPSSPALNISNEFK